jgi:hypothetical protein
MTPGRCKLLLTCIRLFVCLMVFNATFNNISALSWRSVLLVEETAGPGENHRPAASHYILYHNNVVHLTLMVIGTDCIGSCKSNYHTITVTTAPDMYRWNIQFWLACNAMSFYTIVLYFNNIHVLSLLFFWVLCGLRCIHIY